MINPMERIAHSHSARPRDRAAGWLAGLWVGSAARLRRLWGLAARRLQRPWGRRNNWLVMGVAIMARLPGLASKPLWYDEAFAVLFSATGPKAMAYGTLAAQAGVAADVHPLGYYTLLWAWTGLFGDRPVTVRLLSVLLGLAAVAVGMSLARELLGHRVALATGLMLAVSPFAVHYSQEVRMYALMALLLIAATWTYQRAVARSGARYWAIFAALAALAQYTHTLSVFYLMALAATSLWKRKIRNTLLAGVAAILLYLPWLLVLPSQFSRLRWAYWVTRPGAAELVRTWLVFVAGLPVVQWSLAISLLGTIMASVLAVIGSYRAKRAGDPRSGWGLWCLYLAAAPTGLMFAFSYWQPVYLDRALLASGLLFLLWLSWGITRPQLGMLYRWTGMAAIALAMAAGLAADYMYRGFPYAPFSELASGLGRATPIERVIHSNKISALPAAYYGPQLELHYLADSPGSASDTLALATQQVLGMLAEAEIEQAALGADRIAFVVFQRELDDYRSLGSGSHPALEWLDNEYQLVSTDRLGDLLIFHYRK